MVAPITGPFNRSIITPDFFYTRSGYRQKRPYNLPLPCTTTIGKLISRTPANNPDVAQNSSDSGDATREYNQAVNASYAKLLGKISDRASMGENLGQLSASARLIFERSNQLVHLVKAARKFDVSGFARWMDHGIVKRTAKSTSNAVLELNFAIVPTVNDIYSAIDILQSPVKNTVVSAKADIPFSKEKDYPLGAYAKSWYESGNVRVRQGCEVAVNNPNLWLANTLGVLNPAQIAWQLLPGSFLFDWLLPVEQFLGSFTDFMGLTTERPFSTYCFTGKQYNLWKDYGWKSQFSSVYMVRGVSVIMPNLTFRPLKVPGVKRALNAVSLAVQALTRR